METISSNRPKIVVIGSCNTDMVVKANRLPVPGETILGGTFYMNPGGKGANQAVAAARMGGEVNRSGPVGSGSHLYLQNWLRSIRSASFGNIQI